MGEVEDRAVQVEEGEEVALQLEEVALQVEEGALQVEEVAHPDTEGPGMDFSIKACMRRY